MKQSLPKGTKDILPAEMHMWHHIEQIFARVCEMFGYQEIRIPTFEYTEVFSRGVGDTTDVVQKEMYTFMDKGGRSLTLRPEGTAGIVRSYIEQGMSSLPSPVKLYYNITSFRYENVQKGRYREFHQFGLETFGAPGPQADCEMISLLVLFFQSLGLQKTNLRINSIGCPTCRPVYNNVLKDYYRPFLTDMCRDCQPRFEKNPLRLLDCKEEKCHELAENAPKLIDRLCPDCEKHFSGLKAGLADLGISYTIDPNIVRGLDYYTRTVFEFISESVGTQGTICGGGRYDGLVELLGGQKTPGVGFAMGVERLLMEMESQGRTFVPEPPSRLYIAAVDEKGQKYAAELAFSLRQKNIPCQIDIIGRSFKAQLKYASKTRIPYVLVLGEQEVRDGAGHLKRMTDGFEQKVVLNDRDAMASLIMGEAGKEEL